jgi:glycoprotein endo-alpha-1,2-mannosidase
MMFKETKVSLNRVIFISFVVLLSMAGISSAITTITWDNDANDGNWNTDLNWSTDIVPPNNSTCYAAITTTAGPVVSTGQTVDVYRILLQGDGNGTLTIDDGTVNVDNHIYVADVSTARGTLNMSGGTINMVGTLYIGRDAGSIGTVNLSGGTIYCDRLRMRSNTPGGTGTINIAGTGKLIINGDDTAEIAPYVTNGWINADGDNTVSVDYNSITDKTTVSSTEPVLVASNPNPANSSVNININPTLCWTPATGAASRDVYFGTSSPGTFQGNQTAVTFNPGTLAKNTTYYWRIDEHTAAGTVTGDVWSFTTVPQGDYYVGAYYYPWYNNNIFHNGSDPIGNNTTVFHLNPQITPQLGWYNQHNASVISQHYKWARYAGIDFFITSYWGMGSDEDNTIRNYMFDNPDRGDIKLAVFLEPRITPTGNSITAADVTNQTNYLCDNYFNRPGYMRIDNKPVIFIYITRAMTDANLSMCISSIRTAATDKGIGDVYIVGDEVWGSPNISQKTPRVSQMDAVTNYDIYGNLGRMSHVTDSKLNTWQNNNTAWKNFVNSLGKQFIPAVSPGFNNRQGTDMPACSRKLNNESSAFGSLFSAMLDRAKLSTDTKNMIIVTSWNEWHEDTEIEPTISSPPSNNDDSGTQYYTQGLYYEGYGMRYLNILRDKTTLLAPCDYDNNNTVDFDNLAYFLGYWLESCISGNNCIEADLNSNGVVSLDDFANCARDWTGN